MLALAGAVALASQGASVWTTPRRGAVDRVDVLVTLTALFAFGLLVAGAVTFVVHRVALPARADAPPLGKTLIRALPGATVCLVVLGLLMIARAPLYRVETDDGWVRGEEWAGRDANPLSVTGWFDSPVMAGEAEPDPDGSAAGSDPAGPLPPVLLLFGALAAAVAGAVWWYTSRSARRRDDAEPDHLHRAAAHGTVVSTIDAMLSDPDPKTAIIGAYARLLEGLAASGTPRRDYEGPTEHLQRVLTVLRVRPEPLRQLIELFEIARFSTHPLTAGHREQALDALRAVASDLATRSPSAGSPSARSGVASRTVASR